MTSGDFSNSYFSLAEQRRRRLVEESTVETRENWFKGYDASEENRLRGRMPQIPPLPNRPDEIRVFDKPFPKRLLIILVGLFIATFAVFFNRAFGILNLLVSLLALVEVFRSQEKSAFFKPSNFKSNPVPVVGACGLIVGMLQLLNRPLSVFLAFGSIIAIISLFVTFILGWIEEKKEVKAHNARVSYQTTAYEAAVRRRDEVFAQRREIERQIDDLAVDCLHPSLMAQERRQLLDSGLEKAFAELGVTQEDQRTVLADKERFVIEISGPTRGFGAIQSPYDHPVVEFQGLLPSYGENDTPALRRYLSHLYICKIGIVLPQGFGIFEAVADCVNRQVMTRGHELLVWKSISRVTRQNADSLDESDAISIQSYGGSETRLPVNGYFINESTEAVPVVKVVDDLGMSLENESPRRLVNSFVLAVQQKMTQSSSD
jgi:hypothetical protein